MGTVKQIIRAYCPVCKAIVLAALYPGNNKALCQWCDAKVVRREP